MGIDRLRESLERVVSNIEAAKEKGWGFWPPNEAVTEKLVIEEVLEGLGYGPLDYIKQPFDTGHKFPDYVVLPDDKEHVWILEAKAWGTLLTRDDAQQAVNYASGRQARWAVLTNGQTWQMYNVHTHGGLADKRIFEIKDICNTTPEDIEVLLLFSKDSVVNGDLDRTYRRLRIRQTVREILLDPSSAPIGSLKNKVGRKLDMNVTSEDIRVALSDLLGGREQPAPESAEEQAVEKPAVSPGEQVWVTLSYLTEDVSHFNYHSPRRVRLESGAEQDVKTWNDVTMFVLGNSGVLDRIGLPFRAGDRAGRYFINEQPVHSDGKQMTEPRELNWNGRTLYVETHYSAWSFMQILKSVFEKGGIDLNSVQVLVQLKEPRKKQGE